jgi:hypothetical protein
MVTTPGRIGLAVTWLTAAIAVQAGADFTLQVEDHRASVTADGAPVVRVLEELGRQAGFEVVADIGDDIVFDAKFDGLPMEEAIKRICHSVGYLVVHDPATSRVRRVVLTPAKARASRTMPRQPNPPGWKPPPPPQEPAPTRELDVKRLEQDAAEEPSNAAGGGGDTQRRDDRDEDD